MFSKTDNKELIIVSRGLALFLLFAIIGITTAEKQMNSLTHWQQSVQVCSLSRGYAGTYSLYLFGNCYSISAVYQIGSFIQQQDKLLIAVGQQRLVIPTKIYFDYKQLASTLGAGIRQLRKSMLPILNFLNDSINWLVVNIEKLIAKKIS